LNELPPELALEVLSNLNATDLCLASCVWQQLASDEILWQSLCKEKWPHADVYKETTEEIAPRSMSYKKIYMRLDEGTLTFNADPQQGMQYFFAHGLIGDSSGELARFFHSTHSLSRAHVRRYLQNRPDADAVLEAMLDMQDFRGLFLPNALRRCFAKLEAPNDRGEYLQRLLGAFSTRFARCNPGLDYSPDLVYVLCFSLILLSVDLSSPHVKNKMSKREFIRNTRNAVSREAGAPEDVDDSLGAFYDNVFLRGHVHGEDVDGAALVKQRTRLRQFVPGYLALFL